MIKIIPSIPNHGCDILGNVYDMTGPQPVILKTYDTGGDLKRGRYHSVYIKKVGIRYVHRLLAETWLASWKPGLHVDHINRVRKDNRAENLRCLTHKENTQNSSSLGVSKQKKLFETFIRLLDGSIIHSGRADEEEAWQRRVDLVDQHYKYNWINDALRDIRTDGVWIFIHKLSTYQYNLHQKYVDRLLAGASIYDLPIKRTKKI